MNLPNSLHRALEEKRARFGLVECVNHDLLQPYSVFHEKPEGGFLLKFGSVMQEIQPTKTLDNPEIKAWLALETKTEKKGRKGDKAEESADTEPMDVGTNGSSS